MLGRIRLQAASTWGLQGTRMHAIQLHMHMLGPCLLLLTCSACSFLKSCLLMCCCQAENKFKCPCHGSQYDATGKKVRGPAPLVSSRTRLWVV